MVNCYVCRSRCVLDAVLSQTAAAADGHCRHTTPLTAATTASPGPAGVSRRRRCYFAAAIQSTSSEEERSSRAMSSIRVKRSQSSKRRCCYRQSRSLSVSATPRCCCRCDYCVALELLPFVLRQCLSSDDFLCL